MRISYSKSLAVAYVGFFLPAGVLLSYLPAFLAGKGMSAARVGVIFSAVFAVKLVTGPILAWWGDQARLQHRLLVAAAWTSVACAVLLGQSRQFEVLLVCVIGISICRNYFQCTLEALATLVKNAGGAPRYGLMRGIGSGAVGLGVVLFGGLWSANATYQQVALPAMVLGSGFVLIACMKTLGAAASVSGPAPGTPRTAGAGRVRAPAAVLLLVGATLVIGANGVFYSTATLLLSQHGMGAPGIALLWCFAFAVETTGFAAFEKLRDVLGSAWFFALAVTLALLRWLLFARGIDLAWLVIAFALHVASFSWLHGFCANWVRDSVAPRYAVTAQAVYTACAHGVGMATAAYLASVLLPTMGSSVFLVAALMTFAGALVFALRGFLERGQGHHVMRTI